MLGIVLIYFLGKAFYDLAGKYGKHQWGFAILGVVTYYAGTFIGGILLGLFAIDFVMNSSDIVIGLVALPIGLAFWLTLYLILKNSWKKNVHSPENTEDILDAEL